MTYIRKTKDNYILLSNYGYGWEEEVIESTYKEIKERLKEYRENCKYGIFKHKKVRVKIWKIKNRWLNSIIAKI